jgi:hypothetical protein
MPSNPRLRASFRAKTSLTNRIAQSDALRALDPAEELIHLMKYADIYHG